MHSPRAFSAALAAALLFAAPAMAQDVTVTAVDWIDPTGAPDELPKVKRTPPLRFPTELQASSDVAYVIFEAVLDEGGKRLALAGHPTLPLLFRISDPGFDDFKFSPAQRAGKGVNSAITFAFLYNPASARMEGPEATPRLLEVAPVRVDAKPMPPGSTPLDEVVVYADLEVGANGLVKEVKNAPAEYARAMVVAARNWRFAPARQNGQPVASKVHAPFVIVPNDLLALSDQADSPAVARVRVPPVYPFAMRRYGLRGEVVVDFVIDIEGRTRNVYVIRSLNPAFDDPAIDAVRKWQFRPALHGGVPVNTHMQVPIVFQLSDEEEGGRDGLDLVRKGDLSKLPPELQYDTPPRLRASARPAYPYAALQARREGHATVNYIVDQTGRVAEAKVIEATSPEFGDALLAAIDRFYYEPALKAGRPSLALLALRHDFDLSSYDADMVRREQKKPKSFVSIAELDTPLKPISRQPPVMPRRLGGRGGEAIIEFIVDEEGRARLVRVVSASDPAVGNAAVQAIATWRFEPPTKGGRVCAARARIPIEFNAKAAPVPASAGGDKP